MSNQKTYYEILGVSRTDDLRHITQAYRKIVKEYHPDKKGEMYRNIFDLAQTAYDILKDEIKRHMYDLTIDDSSNIEESDVDYENTYMGNLGDFDSESEDEGESGYSFYCYNDIYYLVPDEKFKIEYDNKTPLSEFTKLIRDNAIHQVTMSELEQMDIEIGKKNSKGEYIFMYPKLYIMKKKT